MSAPTTISTNSSYAENADCRWLLRCPLVNHVPHVTFNEYSLDDSDFVKLWDGVHPDSSDLICQGASCDGAMASQASLLVQLVSDNNVTAGGFVMAYSCVQTSGIESEPECQTSGIESAIVSPYSIDWDASPNGQIRDGGGDMYDSGNRITTSLCSDRISPYTDDMTVIPSDCFGSGGSYMMDIRTSMMVLLTQNTGVAELTISISGNLGADGGGTHVSSSFSSGSLVGYMTSVCAAGSDPSVNHLFVIDATLSPNAEHTFNPNTDSDADSVAGIGAGSPILYILYSSTSGGCHSDEEHRAIFDAAVQAIVLPVEVECCARGAITCAGLYDHDSSV